MIILTAFLRAVMSDYKRGTLSLTLPTASVAKWFAARLETDTSGMAPRISWSVVLLT